MNREFLVLKWNDIEDKLSSDELELFYDFLNKITEDKLDEDDFYVFPKAYIDGYRKGQEFSKIERKEKKEKLLKELEELKKLANIEIAHLEADEAIINFISDKDITKAFESIKKCYN